MLCPFLEQGFEIEKDILWMTMNITTILAAHT